MEKKPENKRRVGAFGEDVAIEFLQNNYVEILAKNFRYKRLGEIDIIAKDEDYICFIEVKTRSNTNYGLPREAVNFKKQQNIKMIAQIYLNIHSLKNSNVRFDVIEVYIKAREKEIEKIEYIKNAF